MTIHNLPHANHFELATPRPARYSLGFSVLVICAVCVGGWAAIGFAAYKLFF